MNRQDKTWFDQWFVGVTDGDGTFGFYYQNNKWSLTYKIAQSKYNLRMLHYIKKQLGVGSITKDNNKGQFFIRDRKKLEKVIFPIFDKYPLLTSKQFDYLKLKKAFLILNDVNKTKDEINKELFALKNEQLPLDYVSTEFKYKLPTLEIKSVNDVQNIISKPWLVGFVEAEGSFYLTSKSSTRIVHGFCITQKLDKIVLEGIKYTLHISTKVVYKDKHNYHMLDTTNSRAIENIISYFQNTMKGMKSVEYRIWSRSYNKNKGDYLKLLKIRNIVRNLKKVKP
jgi:LAGLIDADG endonuclease